MQDLASQDDFTLYFLRASGDGYSTITACPPHPQLPPSWLTGGSITFQGTSVSRADAPPATVTPSSSSRRGASVRRCPADIPLIPPTPAPSCFKFASTSFRVLLDPGNPDPGLRRGAALPGVSTPVIAALITGSSLGGPFPHRYPTALSSPAKRAPGGQPGYSDHCSIQLPEAFRKYAIDRGGGVITVGHPDRDAWVLINASPTPNCVVVETIMSITVDALSGETPGEYAEEGQISNYWIRFEGRVADSDGSLTVSYGRSYTHLPGLDPDLSGTIDVVPLAAVMREVQSSFSGCPTVVDLIIHGSPRDDIAHEIQQRYLKGIRAKATELGADACITPLRALPRSARDYCTRTETGAHIPAITSSRAESRAAASVQAPPGPLAALRDLLLQLLQTIPGDYMQQSWSTLSPTWQYEVDEDLQDVPRAVECFTTFLSQVNQIRWPNARQYGRRCHNLISAEALLDVVAGCLDDLRRLPGIQEAAPPTQLLEAESHGCSGVGSRDGTPQRGTGRSSNIALEPEYGRSHGRSLSLPQVGEGVTARALPATHAGREVADLYSSGGEEDDSEFHFATKESAVMHEVNGDLDEGEAMLAATEESSVMAASLTTETREHGLRMQSIECESERLSWAEQASQAEEADRLKVHTSSPSEGKKPMSRASSSSRASTPSGALGLRRSARHVEVVNYNPHAVTLEAASATTAILVSMSEERAALVHTLARPVSRLRDALEAHAQSQAGGFEGFNSAAVDLASCISTVLPEQLRRINTSTSDTSAGYLPSSCVHLAHHIFLLPTVRRIAVVGCGKGDEWAVLVALLYNWLPTRSDQSEATYHLHLIDGGVDVEATARHIADARLLFACLQTASCRGARPQDLAHLIQGDSFHIGPVSISIEHKDGWTLPASAGYDLVYSAAFLSGSHPSRSLIAHLLAVAGGSGYLCMHHRMWCKEFGGQHCAAAVPYLPGSVQWPEMLVGKQQRVCLTRDLRSYPRFAQREAPKKYSGNALDSMTWPDVSETDQSALDSELRGARVHLRPEGWLPVVLGGADCWKGTRLIEISRIAVFWSGDDFWHFGFYAPCDLTRGYIIYDDGSEIVVLDLADREARILKLDIWICDDFVSQLQNRLGSLRSDHDGVGGGENGGEDSEQFSSHSTAPSSSKPGDRQDGLPPQKKPRARTHSAAPSPDPSSLAQAGTQADHRIGSPDSSEDLALRAQLSCSSCGLRGATFLVECASTGRLFCNTISAHWPRSCIIKHLGDNGLSAVNLLGSSPVGHIPLSCVVTGSTDIFRLGFILAPSHVAVVSEGSYDESDRARWMPVVMNGALASWLSPPASSSECADIIRSAGAHPLCNLAAGASGRLTFENRVEYYEYFSRMIAEYASYEAKSSSVVLQNDLRVTWDLELNGHPIAIFDSTTFASRAKVGDRISLTRGGSDSEPWTTSGTIRAVQGSTISAVLEGSLNTENSGFQLRLIQDAVTAERMQTALHAFVFDDFSVSSSVFNGILGTAQNPEPVLVTEESEGDLEARGLNDEQRLAYHRAINPISLIQGPPGTGKTHTASAIIQCFVRQRTQGRPVLVCTSSNHAGNHVAVTLLESAPDISILRLTSKAYVATTELPDRLSIRHHVERCRSRVSSSSLDAKAPKGRGRAKGSTKDMAREDQLKLLEVFESLLQNHGALIADHERQYRALVAEFEVEAIRSCDVLVITNSVGGDKRVVSAAPFEIVVQDEATQSTEPETLVAITLGCRRLVLIGDHCQLGPVIKSPELQAQGLGVSMFERLRGRPDIPFTVLTVQHRMHPVLSLFPSQQFYDGSLVDEAGVRALRQLPAQGTFPWPNRDTPLLVIDVQGSETVGQSGTYLNESEAGVAVSTVLRLLGDGFGTDCIKIITPYSGQRTAISSKLRALSLDIPVTSVDAVQGQESDFIILSLVRSNARRVAGFVPDPRRLNVALTRCRRGLVVICNRETLERNGDFKDYFKYADSLNAVVRSLESGPADLEPHTAAANATESSSDRGSCSDSPSPLLIWQPNMPRLPLLDALVPGLSGEPGMLDSIMQLSDQRLLGLLDRPFAFCNWACSRLALQPQCPNSSDGLHAVVICKGCGLYKSRCRLCRHHFLPRELSCSCLPRFLALDEREYAWLQAVVSSSIKPEDLRVFWRCVGRAGFGYPVVGFYEPREGQYRSFSNFFAHAPIDFEIPEACGRDRLVASGRSAIVRITFLEKAIMLCKAAVMDDLESFDAILRASTAIGAKKLGRGVSNWNQAVWDSVVCEVARASVFQKFSKVDGLSAVLLATGSQVLAEMTSRDVNWGTGIDIGCDGAADPARWPGTNVLGWALMVTRAQIRDNEAVRLQALASSTTRPFLPGCDRFAAQLRPSPSGQPSEWLAHRTIACLAHSSSVESDFNSCLKCSDADVELGYNAGLGGHSLEDLGHSVEVAICTGDSCSRDTTANGDDSLWGYSAAAQAFTSKAQSKRRMLSRFAKRAVPRFSRFDGNDITVSQRTLAWLRRLAWLWRARIAGCMYDPHATRRYWRLSNSPTADAGNQLVKLASDCRFDRGATLEAAFNHLGIRIRERCRPLPFYPGASSLLRSRWPSPTRGLRWRLSQRGPSEGAVFSHPDLEQALVLASEQPSRIFPEWSSRPPTFTKAQLTQMLGALQLPIDPVVITSAGRFELVPVPQCPDPDALRRASGVQYFAVRLMRCMYSTLAALGLMAQPSDFEMQRTVGDAHISFYALSVKSLLAVEPNGVMVFGGGLPGVWAFACASLGMPAVIVDVRHDHSKRRTWFANACERLGIAKVSFWRGNALDSDAIEAALRHHSADAICVGRDDSFNCEPHSTLQNLTKKGRHLGDAASAGLGQGLFNGLQGRDGQNVPYFSENVSGSTTSNTSHGARCTHLSYVEFGGTSNDRHSISHHSDSPLIVDEQLRAGGRYLFSRSCAGKHRPLQPLGPDGMSSAVCCEGQCCSLVGSGSISTRKVLEVLRMPSDFGSIANNKDLLKAFPPSPAAFVSAQTCMHRLHLEHGVPIVSYDASLADPRLGSWHQQLHARIQESSEIPTHFPVRRISIVILPSLCPGKVCVDNSGSLPFVDVDPRMGRSIELLLVEQIGLRFPSIRLGPHSSVSFRFVCDLSSLAADDRVKVGSILFSSTFVGDSVAKLPPYSECTDNPCGAPLAIDDVGSVRSRCRLSGTLLDFYSKFKSPRDKSTSGAEQRHTEQYSGDSVHLFSAPELPGVSKESDRPLNYSSPADERIRELLIELPVRPPELITPADVMSVQPRSAQDRYADYRKDYAALAGDQAPELDELTEVAATSGTFRPSPVELQAVGLVLVYRDGVISRPRGSNRLCIFGGYVNSSSEHFVQSAYHLLRSEIIAALGLSALHSDLLGNQGRLFRALINSTKLAYRSINAIDSSGKALSRLVPIRQVQIKLIHLRLEDLHDIRPNIFSIGHGVSASPTLALFHPATINDCLELSRCPISPDGAVTLVPGQHLQLPALAPSVPPFVPGVTVLGTPLQIIGSCALLGVSIADGVHGILSSIFEAYNSCVDLTTAFSGLTLRDITDPLLQQVDEVLEKALQKAHRGRFVRGIMAGLGPEEIFRLGGSEYVREQLLQAAAQAAFRQTVDACRLPREEPSIDLRDYPWIQLSFRPREFRLVRDGRKTVDLRQLHGQVRLLYFSIRPGWLIRCSPAGTSAQFEWRQVVERKLFDSPLHAVEWYGESLLPGAGHMSSTKICLAYQEFFGTDPQHRDRLGFVCWRLSPVPSNALRPGFRTLRQPQHFRRDSGRIAPPLPIPSGIRSFRDWKPDQPFAAMVSSEPCIEVFNPPTSLTTPTVDHGVLEIADQSRETPFPPVDSVAVLEEFHRANAAAAAEDAEFERRQQLEAIKKGKVRLQRESKKLTQQSSAIVAEIVKRAIQEVQSTPIIAAACISHDPTMAAAPELETVHEGASVAIAGGDTRTAFTTNPDGKEASIPLTSLTTPTFDTATEGDCPDAATVVSVMTGDKEGGEKQGEDSRESNPETAPAATTTTLDDESSEAQHEDDVLVYGSRGDTPMHATQTEGPRACEASVVPNAGPDDRNAVRALGMPLQTASPGVTTEIHSGTLSSGEDGRESDPEAAPDDWEIAADESELDSAQPHSPPRASTSPFGNSSANCLHCGDIGTVKGEPCWFCSDQCSVESNAPLPEDTPCSDTPAPASSPPVDPPITAETVHLRLIRTAVPKGIFSEQFLDSSHIVCNFVGRSNSRQRQLDLTRRFNQQFPFAHVRMQSSSGRENNLIHQSESADMPTIAHLLVGRLYSLNAAAARYSLQVTGVAANTFDRLSKHIHRHPEVSTVVFPDFSHHLDQFQWEIILGHIGDLQAKHCNVQFSVVAETAALLADLHLQAAPALASLEDAHQAALAHALGAENLDTREALVTVAEELHLQISRGAAPQRV